MLSSLDRSLTILECLAKQKSIGVTEIAERFCIDKSTATRIMQTFAKHDIVVKDEFTQKYRISNGTLQLSHQIFLNNKIIEVARPFLLELAKITKETARLCAISHDCIYILEQVQSQKNTALKSADIPGTRKPLHCSAIGKVMLAYMPAEEAREILQRLDRKQYTENTNCDVEALMEQLKEIRQQGYALNLAEYTDRAYCVAVPVFDDNGEAAYSIGFSGLTDYRQQPEHFIMILAYMKDSAKRLTNAYRSELRK